MSGLYNNGLPQLAVFEGDELFNLDTQSTQGINPASAASNLMELSIAVRMFETTSSAVTVAGTRYYRSVTIAYPTLVTGIRNLIGSTGGSDNWLVELHNSTGALVATSALTGALVGTAATWQTTAFTTPYQAAAGTYYIAIQSNGTTAHLSRLQSPIAPSGFVTGSSVGVFGTSAAITPPTTYALAVGPVALLY